MTLIPENQDIAVIAFVKQGERWVVIYPADRWQQAIHQISRWAADRDLSLSWYDAAMIAQKVRAQRQAAAVRGLERKCQ
jgi:hypothetical protein